MSQRPKECRHTVSKLTDYIEQDLSAHDRALLDEHLAKCRYCRDVLEDLRRTIALLSQMPKRQPPVKS